MEDKIYGVIYKLTNKINGRIYIGQTTKRLKERWWNHVKFAHRKDMEDQKSKLHEDINKYGKDGFEMEILCECYDKKTLDIIETYLIKRYKAIMGDECYNRRLGIHLSEEAKAKISKAKMGQPAWNKGKKCKNLSGKNNGMYGKFGKQRTSKPVICKDLEGNVVKTFVSLGAATAWAKSLGFEKASSSAMSAVCRGLRKVLYGYNWEYAEE
jgi:group I intron endonuclease